ncbi:Dehydrodolichyl diphosphate synthase 2, partial [Mucuna pruriens]
MFSVRLPIPIVNSLTPPPKTTRSPSYSYSHYYPFHSHSQTQQLIVPKRGSATAPPSVTLRDDGDSPHPLPAELVAELMPKHVAVIIDGHRRWAELRGLPPSAGYRAGVQSLRKVVSLCCSWGIEVLTVFLYSTENMLRPKVIHEEVDHFMWLVETTLNSAIDCMKKEEIRISMIGDSSKLPKSLQRMITSAEESTKHNSRFQLIVAIAYGGKYEVVQACKSVAKKVKDGLLHLDSINEHVIEQELETNCTEFPYPDLLIRVDGELRISNFLLWQLAYTELYFNEKSWPDFGKDEFVDRCLKIISAEIQTLWCITSMSILM